MARSAVTFAVCLVTAAAGGVAGIVWHSDVQRFVETRWNTPFLRHVFHHDEREHGPQDVRGHEHGVNENDNASTATTQQASATVYYCPMHPSYRSDRPGNCPICNMTLVPLESGAAGSASTTASSVAGRATVTIPPERRQLVGVRVATAASEKLAKTIRAAGRIEASERGLSVVTLKYRGWIDQLFVKASGDVVRKDDPLLSIYSPELYEAKVNYQSARAQASAGIAGTANEDSALRSARERLRLWDVSDEQIRALDSGEPPDVHTTVSSKFDGVVMRREVIEGAMVEPGASLFELADLSKVWIVGDVFADEARLVTAGQDVSIVVAALGAEPIRGKVDYVYPYLNETARTVRVRVEVDNVDGRLKPGAYATVSIDVDLGEGVVVDVDAVLDTGTRQVVFVDLGDGRFEPREVKLGDRSAGRAVVLEGLAAGERIVTSGTFLVDSESRLQSALGAMAPASGHEGHVGHEHH